LVVRPGGAGSCKGRPPNCDPQTLVTITTGETVEYGAHLPLIAFEREPTLRDLKAYAHAATSLGYRWLSANDHLVYPRTWLDGLAALTAVIEDSGDLTLATTVSLPVVRGPASLAKALAAIDVLSEGRLVAGLGPGSSAHDYAAVGVPFEERWQRFDEAVRAVRTLLGSAPAYEGRFYAAPEALPEARSSPRTPIWVASWGSSAGLRRAARHGDGWVASAYNIGPERFEAALGRLRRQLAREGRPPDALGNVLATTWLHVTDDRAGADRVLADVLAPMLRRSVEELRALSLPIGPPDICAERLAAYARAGVERVLVWPIHDELRQLELFQERVAPLVATA
jgi:alkanesulfonate monooxygenase SsuD/methylene tetrahydromethanopterin reductase-like flavin-dependent oxidoreductase (luciferase family)